MPEPLKKDQLLPLIREKIEAIFQDVAFVHRVGISHEKRRGEGPDLVVEIWGEERLQVLLIEARTSGEPRFAREAANALLVAQGLWTRAYPVFAAPFLSDEARAVCRDKKIGYLDLAGNCRMAFDNLYIHTQGGENPFKSKRTLKTLGKPKSSRIIRVLLNHARREWRTRDLAQEAGVSQGLVSHLKKILRAKEWIDNDRKNLVLTRPAQLLEAWIHELSAPETIPEQYFSPLDFTQIENRIIQTCRHGNIPYGFTGLSGAVHLVSGIDYRQVQAYVGEDPDRLVGELGLEKGGQPATVTLMPCEDSGVLYGSRKIMPASRLQYARPEAKTIQSIEEEIQTRLDIVSPVQIYCDLKSTIGDYDREAERLFAQVIQPSW